MRKILFLTALAIIVPLVVFGFLGCMKKPDHTPNYGPETPYDTINSALADTIPPQPESIKMEQYVSIDITQVIDTQSPVTLSQKLDKVTAYDAKTDPSEIKWTFFVDMNELSEEGVWKNWKQPFNISYGKTSQQSFSTSAVDENPSRLSAFNLKALQTSDATSPLKVTYHNFKREDGYTPVPPLVAKRADCGGVKDCAKGLRYMRFSFDRVVWDTETHGTRTSYRITFSPDIPTYIADWSHPGGIYPTNQLQFCAQTWIEIDNNGQKQVVPVQQCADMRDFQFGHDVL